MTIRMRIVILLALLAALLPVDLWQDRSDSPEGDTYVFTSITAYGWSAYWNRGPGGHLTTWRVTVPGCCEDWTPGGWYGYLPSFWIDYCLFCGQPGNAPKELMVWFRAPHAETFAWGGSIIGWSTEEGWWSNVACTVDWWPWRWAEEECR